MLVYQRVWEMFFLLLELKTDSCFLSVFWRRRHPNLTVLLPVNMNVLCFWFCLWYRSTFGKPFGYSDIHRGTGPFQFLNAHCYSTGGWHVSFFFSQNIGVFSSLDQTCHLLGCSFVEKAWLCGHKLEGQTKTIFHTSNDQGLCGRNLRFAKFWYGLTATIRYYPYFWHEWWWWWW